MATRNFSIGSRDMAVAGRMIVDRNFHGGYQSKRDISQRWGYFSLWAYEQGVKKMENVTFALVVEYGQQLQRELDAGQRKSSSAPKNYVSAVNTVLKVATNNAWQTVRPGKDCGIQKRVYIPTENKAMTEATHQSAQNSVGERIASLLALQRAFGLRFKESCLLNPKRALKEALSDGRITLKAGTKGGKHRTVPCRPCGIVALKNAILVQDGRSMIPKNRRYVDFRRECYEQAAIAGISFHPERHAFAQERYTEITGAPAPLDAGWSRKERLLRLASFLTINEDEAKTIDHDARLQISIELGHHRVEIANAYLG
ncbi:MAG: integrase domain-containing protein [Methylobacter sp.]